MAVSSPFHGSHRSARPLGTRREFHLLEPGNSKFHPTVLLGINRTETITHDHTKTEPAYRRPRRRRRPGRRREIPARVRPRSQAHRAREDTRFADQRLRLLPPYAYAGSAKARGVGHAPLSAQR